MPNDPRDLADLRRFYRFSDAQLADNQYDIVRAERRLAELRRERVELIESHDALAAEIRKIEVEQRKFKAAEGRKSKGDD